MQTITEGFFYQNEYSGVILGAVVLPHGTLLIDSPLRPDEARSWKSILLTQSRGTHRLLVNLDSHIDRTLGNRYIDLTILAHTETASAIENRANVFKGQIIDTGSEWEKYPETLGTRWTDPIITFDKQLCLHWGNHEIHLVHRPGPTSGSIWVEIPSEKVLFLGDAVVENQPPFLANANIPTWLESLGSIHARKYNDYTIISGRSGKISIETVRNQQAILKSILGRLDTMARKKIEPDGTEKMIPALLNKWNFPQKLKSYYTHRLRHGLLHYYLENYSINSILEEE